MKKKAIINGTLFYVLITAFGLFMIYPLLWMLTSSFKPGNEMFKGVSCLPKTSCKFFRSPIQKPL